MRRDSVRRPRLSTQLSQGLLGPMTLVVAPTGYGKTALLAEWAASSEGARYPTTWLSLDENDNDPILFLEYVTTALSHLDPYLASRAEELLRTQRSPDALMVAATLMNDFVRLADDSVLCLDDFHAISDPAVHHLLEFIVQHLPPQLHLVVLSRVNPPIPLTLLRARRHLTEIHAADLRFTHDEVAELFAHAAGIELSADDVAQLHEATEGWAAALQLTMLSIQAHSDSAGAIRRLADDSTYVFEHLAAEVIDRQTEGVRTFLMATSILDRMCAPLCDALLDREEHAEAHGLDDSACGVTSSRAILEYLNETNLFTVPLDKTGQWYRYHPLFAGCLRRRLQETRSAAEVSLLHRRASEWLAAQGLRSEAMSQATSTGDWDFATRQLETLFDREDFTVGGLRTFCVCTAAIPPDVMQAHPKLRIFGALARAHSGNPDGPILLKRVIADLESEIELETPGTIGDEYEGLLALLRLDAMTAPDPRADPVASLVLARRARALMPAAEPTRSMAAVHEAFAHMATLDIDAAERCLADARELTRHVPYPYAERDVSYREIRLAHERGLLREGHRLYRMALEGSGESRDDRESSHPQACHLDIALGCILAEQGRWAEAERTLIRGLEEATAYSNHDSQLAANAALTCMYAARGRGGDALSRIALIRNAWPDFAFLADALCVRHALWYAPGNTSTIVDVYAWLAEFSPYSDDTVHLPGLGHFAGGELYFQAYLIWARAQVAVGRPDLALDYINRSLELAQAHQLNGRAIALLVEQAIALGAAGQSRRATDALIQAVALGHAEGYYLVFDGEPALIAPLSRVAQRGDSVGTYTARLLDGLATKPETTIPAGVTAIGATTESSSAGRMPPARSLPPLTEREAAVLALVAEGLSNARIASELYVEITTVKGHLVNIMRKLQASNRTEAVIRARAIGLLR